MSGLLLFCVLELLGVQGNALRARAFFDANNVKVGDPLVLTQIGCVTQLVMCPKCDKAPARRKLWIAALERARANATDDYVKTFCRQQLDLCR